VSDAARLAWWAAGGWVVALLLLWAWWAGVRFCRLLKDLPTVPIRGIFVGLVETTGRARCATPLEAGISGAACVHHAWSVAEHWRRTETYRDKDGKTHTRTVTGSDTVASGGGSVDFTLVDDTGTIDVRVAGADWRPAPSVSTTVSRGDPLYHTKAPGTVVSGSTGLRTFTEHIVAVDAPLYVVGSAGIAARGTALELHRDLQEDDLLILSTGDERSVSRGRLAWAVAAYIMGLGAAAVGGAPLGLLALDAAGRPPSGALAAREPYAWGAVAGAAAFGALSAAMWAVIMRNGVVRVRTRWERAGSLVEVELARRADLIPNLVAVTQGLAGHERAVQTAVAALRAGAAAKTALRALVEAYPSLKADGAFLALQRELADTEDRIALARRFEIESRAAFLERLRTFPEGVVARLLGVAAPPPELDTPGARATR
jgi:hypothetical protein